MSKYAKLSAHLSALPGAEWVAEFHQIEAVLGFTLPASARSYPAWWSNQSAIGHSQTQGWKSVGWRTSSLDLVKERVTFVRDTQPSPPSPAQPATTRTTLARGLTIAEAKAGLAAYFGVQQDAIEITIKG